MAPARSPHDQPSGTFDRLAPSYDEALEDAWRRRFSDDNAFFIHQKCRAMLRELDRRGSSNAIRPPRPLLALDVGCGRGPAVAFLADRWRIVGADVSLQMLNEAPRGLRLVAQEPFALPFSDGTFDVVFAFCVYHHVQRDQHVAHLRELARVARPGGHVFVFEHNPHNPVTRTVFRRAPIDRGCEMIPPGRLRQVFTAAGLTDFITRYVLFAPAAVAEILPGLDDALRWLPIGGQYYVVARKSDRRPADR